MPTLTLGGVAIDYKEGYNPIKLTQRMSKHTCLNGVSVIQSFGLVAGDSEASISGVERTSVLKSIITLMKAGNTIALTDQWDNAMTVKIKNLNVTPIKGTITLQNYQIELWVVTITKLCGEAY